MTSPQVPPPVNHKVTVAEGAEHTRRHRALLPADPAMHPRGSHGGSFEARQVQDLLATEGCAYLMIYHGRNAAGVPSLVLIARDAQGRDLVGTNATALEVDWPCPPFCDPTSTLNG